jgi:hypothetical protein
MHTHIPINIRMQTLYLRASWDWQILEIDEVTINISLSMETTPTTESTTSKNHEILALTKSRIEPMMLLRFL